MLALLLPARLVGWKAIKKKVEASEKAFLAQLAEQTQKSMRFAGSFFEGYNIPACVVNSSPLRVEQNTDLDVIALFDAKIGHEKNFTSPEYAAILETENINPGYARLWVHKLPEKKKEFSIFQESVIYSNENDRYYLSSSLFREKALFVTSQDSDDCTVHGPALMFGQAEPLVIGKGMFENFDGLDIVPAYPITEWPLKLAEELQNRANRSEWLSSDFVDSIIKEGCQVVPIPHKKSSCPELEWRLSFSLSEVRIARELVTDKQRQCYLFLKILRKQTMKQLETLSSYHCKTIFLYSCERLPVSVWEERPGSCLIYMLDCLIECIRKRFFPSYFVPERNMINHLTEEELDYIMAVLRTVRMDVIEPLLSFTDSRIFGFLPVKVPFRMIVQYVVKDMKLFQTHRSLVKSKLNVFIPTTVGLAKILLHETYYEGISEEEGQHKITEAVAYLLDVFKLVNEDVSAPSIPVNYLLNTTALSLNRAHLAMKFYETALMCSDKYPEIPALRGNLACMYHSVACTYPYDTKEHKAYLEKAINLFTEFVEKENNRGSVIDYAVVLLYKLNYSKCKVILENFISEERENSEIPRSTQFGVSEIDRSDNYLKEEVKRHGAFQASALAFAYYFLLKCLIQMEHTDKTTEQTLQDFEMLCNKSAKPRTFSLLGYSLMERQLWGRAKLAFSKALAIQKDYSLAQENISACEKNENM